MTKHQASKYRMFQVGNVAHNMMHMLLWSHIYALLDHCHGRTNKLDTEALLEEKNPILYVSYSTYTLTVSIWHECALDGPKEM